MTSLTSQHSQRFFMFIVLCLYAVNAPIEDLSVMVALPYEFIIYITFYIHFKSSVATRKLSPSVYLSRTWLHSRQHPIVSCSLCSFFLQENWLISNGLFFSSTQMRRYRYSTSLAYIGLPRKFIQYQDRPIVVRRQFFCVMY
jgi:hypothetical protein